MTAKSEIMDRYLAHLRVIEDQIEPHSFNTHFVELGKGHIEFDHWLSSAEIKLAHELFGIRAMANIETLKNFEWSFALNPRIHTKQVLFVKSLRARGRELDCQRQKRAVKPKDIPPQTKGREIAFPLIADLLERQFTFPAVVEIVISSPNLALVSMAAIHETGSGRFQRSGRHAQSVPLGLGNVAVPIRGRANRLSAVASKRSI